MHETTEDREKQSVALFCYQRHLDQLGVTGATIHETPQGAMLPYDAKVCFHGMYTTVIEVKCLNYRSDEIDKFDGIMVKKPQLSALRKEFYHKSGVTGKHYWNKEVIILVKASDHVCYAINLRRVMEYWPDCAVVPQEFVRTNHGKEQADFECRYIPATKWDKF